MLIDLPSELLDAPLPLIGFSGLDVTRNAVHKSIWDAFSCNRKADRAAVQFKLLPPSYEFPVAKPKRASYEWYHPKGILKRNWMLKHLHVLPSVVVLFQDIEWNDVQWTDKQLQCAALLQGLKNALQERNTRLCLVVLQTAAPLPPGEDLLASERAASLTTACGMNSKMLFVLPHTEHLNGYALRLESAFLDMAQSYYALMSKRIRTHRDQLTAAHTTLKIRHQFKLGFVAEMRQDFSTALKHYTQSYGTLDEIRITDTNALEIKTVAGFLNYKICHLMFKLKVPRDAINHFISHIDKYRNRVGFKDLIFEHYAWLSTQHSVFAELFCKAIKNGLPALQTQHPGIYFHKAAEHIVKRRDAFQEACATMSPTEQTTNLPTNNMSLYTEFFGVRAVKTGEPAAEQQMNALIRDAEKSFNHSTAIINLLSQARAQFKIYKCMRFRKKLTIDMAEEYFRSGEHAKALTFYSLMLPDYRQEKWSSIFSDVLLKTLRCALLSASVNDYVSCSIEALSLKIRCEQKERELVAENLWKVLQCVPPLAQGQLAPELRPLWEQALANAKTHIPIDLDKINDFLCMCTTFERMELTTTYDNDVIRVHLIVRTLTDVPIKIRHFTLLISDGANSYKLHSNKYLSFANLSELRASHESNAAATTTPPATAPAYQQFDGDLQLKPQHYYQLLFTTEAQQFHENTQLHVQRIEAHMGSDKLSALLTKSTPYARNAFRHYTRCAVLDDSVRIQPACYIMPTFHLSTQTDLGIEPMLVNEYYAIHTTVTNPHNLFLQNVGLNISVPDALRNKVFLTTDVTPNRQKLHNSLQIDIGELSTQGSSSVVSYYCYSLVPAQITLQQKLWYSLDVQPAKLPAALAAHSGHARNADGSGRSATAAETPPSSDNSPANLTAPPDVMRRLQLLGMPSSAAAAAAAGAPTVQIEYSDEMRRVRKTCDTTLRLSCELEFEFSGRFYTLSKKALGQIYRGENFLFRANIELQSTQPLDILETYFICDHNLMQSAYSFKRKRHTNTYERGDRLEDVIVLRTNATQHEWLSSAKELERSNKPSAQSPPNIFRRLQSARLHSRLGGGTPATSTAGGGKTEPPPSALSAAAMNRSLVGKIPTNMTIKAGLIASASSSALMMASQTSTSSNLSDEGGKIAIGAIASEDVADANAATAKPPPQTRLVYNKAMDAIQATGHCRGFIKGVLLPPEATPATPAPPSATANAATNVTSTIFGIYCIKWRRHGRQHEDNESKFVINGMGIVEPPLNIYATVEERIYVKMPMTFKVVLKNNGAKVLHLIATLSIIHSGNFICSGHTQLDISISAFGEKQLVYNLYPLYVGWQYLPELTLAYNTQADPSKAESENTLLGDLVERAVPKKVFILPPLSQQLK